jgi:hypothetical protein
MFIYHIERTDNVGCDEAAGFIIATKSEWHARDCAAKRCGDEGPDVWLTTAKVSHIGNTLWPVMDGAQVIMRDYRAG